MSSYRVLIVEDEGLIAHDIASRLKALGHTVVGTAGTAEEALQLAAQADLVLMDIRLDGPKDGIDAAREIREQYHLPVIFLTAHADHHTLERAKLAEPFGYIVKPMGHASLQTSLELAMYKHGMERQLEERESWLRTTLSSVAEAVVVTDPRGNVILANRAAEDLFGPAISDVSKALPGDPVPLSILRDTPVPIDAQLRDQAVEGMVAPVKASGKTVGVVLTLRDVTVRRWQEQQLRHAQKMEVASRLAAGVSGEYATLLGIIRKETQRLMGRFTGQSSIRQSLDEIQQAILGAEEITRRLSGLGTRQVGKPEAISINSVLRRMTRTLEVVAGGRVDVSVKSDPAAAKIFADAAQIEQVILSVTTLCCSVAPAGAKLRIDTANAEKHVQLSLRLSEPLGELSASLHLELSIAQGIVAEYDGFLTMSAHGFDALLPAWQQSEVTAAMEEEPRTILLIEERETVRMQLHNFFESHGYNLVEAADRDEAIALLELHSISSALSPDELAVEELPEHVPAAGEKIDLVIGASAAVEGLGSLNAVPVLPIDQPPFQAMSQSALLDHVRALFGPRLTFSASA